MSCNTEGTAAGRIGNTFVVSGPSGVGKGTLIKRALLQVSGAWKSVSYTERGPRDGEVAGEDYIYITPEEFDELLAEDGFLEWAVVHGHRYGTPRKPVEEALEANKQTILEIDVQGAMQVRGKYPDVHLIFIAPPSMEELRRRLVARDTEAPADVEKRMANAELEMARRFEYDYVIVNDDIDTAAAELISIMEGWAAGERKEA